MDRTDKTGLALFLLAFVVVGGSILTVIYGIVQYMKNDPMFMAIIFVIMIAGPTIAYNIGVSHGHKRTHEQYHSILNSVTASMNGAKIIEGRSATVKREPPRPIVYTGAGSQQQLGPGDPEEYNYRRVLVDMVRFGYPYFTRDFLRNKGAFLGANENYTDLTEWLQKNKMIRRVVRSNVPQYEWANPDSGKRYAQADAEGFINNYYPEER